jgi:hypothetical protein
MISELPKRMLAFLLQFAALCERHAERRNTQRPHRALGLTAPTPGPAYA